MSYVELDKSYKMSGEVPPRCCISRRAVLLAWGYCKIIYDAILLFHTVQSLLYVFGFDDVYRALGTFIFILLTAVLITDVIFSLKLIYGISKNKVKNLIMYCKFTKLMWVVVIIEFAVFFFLLRADWIREVFLSPDATDTMIVNICATFAVTVIQTLIMLLVMKEIKNCYGERIESEVSSPKKRVYSLGFTFTIETCTEDEKNQYTNIDGVTTGEKEGHTV